MVVFVFLLGHLVVLGQRPESSGGGAIIVIIVAVALIALAWLLSQMVRLALSRSRELLADAGSVELTKNPDAMISALRKIENRGEFPGATSAVMELCLDNPREGFGDLFATHPSVQTRVQALVKLPVDTIPGHWRCPRMAPARPGQPIRPPAKPRRRCLPARGATPRAPPTRRRGRLKALGAIIPRPVGPPLGGPASRHQS